jgi:hypothetical protein
MHAAFKNLADALANMANTSSQQSKLISHQLSALQEAVMAPTELVTDPNGRPKGARKVLPSHSKALN